MANLDEMKARYLELEKQAGDYKRAMSSIHDQMEVLDLKIKWATYTCTCVRLNKDLDIWDMSQQEEQGRRPLGFGSVSDTLSADKNCPICHGTGIPPENK